MTPLNRAAQALTESLNTSSINGDLATFAVIAVLKAIREPSEEMLTAGWGITPCEWEGIHGHMREPWRRMIDTIINEGGAK